MDTRGESVSVAIQATRWACSATRSTSGCCWLGTVPVPWHGVSLGEQNWGSQEPRESQDGNEAAVCCPQLYQEQLFWGAPREELGLSSRAPAATVRYRSGADTIPWIVALSHQPETAAELVWACSRWFAYGLCYGFCLFVFWNTT